MNIQISHNFINKNRRFIVKSRVEYIYDECTTEQGKQFETRHIFACHQHNQQNDNEQSNHHYPFESHLIFKIDDSKL